MVKELKKVLEDFEAKSGKKVDLLACLKMDDLVDKWSVILAASWINSENNRTVFDEFAGILTKELSSEDLDSVARIGIYSSDVHLIGELMKYPEGSIIEDEQVNGNMVYEGHVIRSSSGQGSSEANNTVSATA